MPGTAARLLPLGLALSGVVLATGGTPFSGGAAPSPATAPAAVVRQVAPPAAVPTTPAAAPARVRTAPAARPTALPATAARVTAPQPASPRTAATATTARTARPAATRVPVRAAAVRTSSCSGTGWQQRRGQAALRSLTPAAGNGYGLRFLGAKPGFYGLTRPSLKMVEVYVRACSKESDALLRHVLGHELGHAYDLTRLTDAQRRAYKAARGIPASTPWYGCGRCTDFATPAGDFAEVYSQWRRGATSNRSQIGNAPSPAQLAGLAQRFFGAS